MTNTESEAQASARIVAIHGFLGRATDWSPVETSLRRSCPGVKFDTLDLFSPSKRAEFIGFKEWAKKFNAAQKDRHAERNVLVGYSLGGRLALAAVLDKPGLWDDVVLISSHLGLSDPKARAERLAHDEKWAQKFLHNPWDQVMAEWNAQKVFVGSTEPVCSEKDFSRPVLASALRAFSLGNQDLEPEKIRALRTKIHLMVGDKDEKYLAVYEQLWAQGFVADATLVENAGHRVLFDQPERIAQKLVEHLKL